MFEESLKEELNIPTIGGTLIAECGFRTDAQERANSEAPIWEWKERERLVKKYWDRSLGENYELRWKILFWFDGPDRRFRGAGADISEASLPTLIQDFEAASGVILQLSATNFSGTYSKRIGTFTNPWLDVVGSNGNFGVRFSMTNAIRSLWRTIPADRIPEVISHLKGVLIHGPQLVETLRSVTQRTG
jgi:hypothetical protein